MNCPRCEGFVEDTWVEAARQYWNRCLNCGWLEPKVGFPKPKKGYRRNVSLEKREKALLSAEATDLRQQLLGQLIDRDGRGIL